MKKINRLSLDESLKKLDVISSEEYKNLTGGEISINSTIKPQPTTRVSYTVKSTPARPPATPGGVDGGPIGGGVGVNGTVKF